MSKIRLGLISETPNPTQIPLLPVDAIEAVFRDVDGILHTGETPSSDILETLSGIAPTQYVNNKMPSPYASEKRIFKFGDVRVGLTHGHRHPLLERYFAMQRRLGNLYAGGRHLLDTLPNRFAEDDVDVIVFGHLHIPLTLERNGVLLVNPGAVYSISKEVAQWELLRETNSERRDLLEAHIQHANLTTQWGHPHSTVGILEIDNKNRITTRIQLLPAMTFA